MTLLDPGIRRIVDSTKMLENVLLALSTAVAALAISDLLLSDETKNRVSELSTGVCNWLDDAALLPFRRLLRKVWLTVAASLLVGSALGALLVALSGEASSDAILGSVIIVLPITLIAMLGIFAIAYGEDEPINELSMIGMSAVIVIVLYYRLFMFLILPILFGIGYLHYEMAIAFSSILSGLMASMLFLGVVTFLICLMCALLLIISRLTMRVLVAFMRKSLEYPKGALLFWSVLGSLVSLLKIFDGKTP